MESPSDSPAATTAKGAVRIEEPSRSERQLGRRVAESRATVPELELAAVVDMSAAMAAREELRAVGGATPLTALVVRACALALREHPRANGAYRDGHFELYARVNVGVAMMSGETVAVPTIADADAKTALEIAAELEALATSVRDGTMTSADVAGATFTIANLGVTGVSSFYSPVPPGQAAILAVGAVRATPVVRGGDIVAGQEMNLTLTCDHRILYGTHAASFLTRIGTLLERTQELLA
jgi:pyruvate dehydrogenase E2 component (dihydrolipoamide acetyltransferase)